MRYKLAGLIVVMLVSAPLYAQTPSVLIVETHNTTNPTAVKTGELITQTYTLKFFDLTEQSQEIIVDEDSLNPGMLGEFKILDLKIDKQIEEGQFRINVWSLDYTLYIANPEKGPYTIPPLTILWRKKDIGQDINDPSVIINTNIQTEEIHLDYVSTIPEKATYIDIRDRISFGEFDNTASVLGWASLFLWVVPPLAGVVLLVRHLRLPAPVRIKKTTVEDEGKYNVEQPQYLSPARAMRNLRRSISKLGWVYAFRIPDKDNISEMRVEMLSSVRDFLTARLPGLHSGLTPLEMIVFIKNNVKDGSEKESLLKLAHRAAIYQDEIERGLVSKEWSINPYLEVREMNKSLKQFRLRNIVLNKLKESLKRVSSLIKFSRRR